MTRQRIESFLRILGLSFDELDSDTWVINDEESGVENLIVVHEDSVIIFRLKVADLPPGDPLRPLRGVAAPERHRPAARRLRTGRQ